MLFEAILCEKAIALEVISPQLGYCHKNWRGGYFWGKSLDKK
jgi:hypothetical protein